MDRLALLAQSSSAARLAGFLVAINGRLSAVGPSTDNVLDLPISQDEMGDIVGLTGVHVNRTLRKFKAEGLLARKLRSIKLLDIDGLNDLAGTPMRAISRACGWIETHLPKPASDALQPILYDRI